MSSKGMESKKKNEDSSFNLIEMKADFWKVYRRVIFPNQLMHFLFKIILRTKSNFTKLHLIYASFSDDGFADPIVA